MITFPQNGTYPFIKKHKVRVHSYAQPRRAGDRKATVISLGAYTFERGDWTPIKDIIDEWYGSDSNLLRLGGAEGRETKQTFKDSFYYYHPQFEGRKVVVLNCHKLKDAENDPELKGHVGLHPEIIRQILENPKYE